MVAKKLSFERLLRGASTRLATSNPPLLPGFDVQSYLKFNPDIANHCAAAADPRLAAVTHYAHYGMHEMRRVIADGVGIEDPSSRLLPGSIHADPHHAGWAEAAQQLASQRGQNLADLVGEHPRAGWLQAGFNFPSYAVDTPEALTQTISADVITFHFLEFGLEAGRSGYPDLWDPSVVRDLYRVKLPEQFSGTEALNALRAKKGAGPFALRESEIFVLNGFAPGLANIFEAEYSHSMRGDSTKNLPSRTKILQDFCGTGWKRLQPVHPEYVFDPDFYLEAYDMPFEKLHGQSWQIVHYHHWLSVGIAQGKAPNLARLAQQIFGMEVPEGILAQLDRYAVNCRKDGLGPDSPPHKILEHMHRTPRPGLECLDISDRVSQSFLRSLGDAKVIAGDPDTGQWLYAMILEVNPDHPRANMAMADILQRKGLAPQSRTLRRRVPNTRENGWNSLNLVGLLQQKEDFNQVAELLTSVAPHVEHDIVMRNHRLSLATEAFYELWNIAADRAEVDGLAETQTALRKIIRSYAPDSQIHLARRSDPIKRVALVGNDDLYQCKLYRVDQKAEQLRTSGYEVEIFSPSIDLDHFVAKLDQFQAVIFFRVPAFPPIIRAIIAAGQAGLATFYEIDDVVFDSDHFPPSFESYANQITRREYDAMACGVPLFERAMELCDYGIASTATLREIMAKKVRSGQVFEHQNALGRLHSLAMADQAVDTHNKAGKPLVLFYGSGTKAHKEDFHELLEPALAEMARKYGSKVEIRLIGHFGKFHHLDPKKHNVRMMTPVWDFEAYCSLLSEADINMSVLSPSVLTDAKSEIKWMEAAMFGTPSVVSATRTYREKITEGETGFLCETAQEFSQALDRLIRDGALRRQVGEAARAKVLHSYSLQAMGQNLRSIFETVRPTSQAKKRIAIVNVFYPPQAIGGATRVVHDNVTLLQKLYGDEFEIDVICTYQGGSNPYAVDRYARDGVRVWAIATPVRADVDHQITDPSMGQAFGAILDQINPDLVHFHCIQRLTTSIIDVTRLRQIPYVITMHDAWWISKNQFVIDDFGTESLYDYGADPADLPERAKLLRRTLFGAAAILPVSPAFARVVEKAGIPDSYVVENGVSTLPEVARAPSENGRVRLAHIGGASRHKGYHHVRNTLLTTEFDNLELLVIDHALPPDMEIRETWGNTPVLRRGKFPQDQIDQLYAQIDVLLAPSTWPESYGLVTREALAAGAWVVASNRGAIGADVTPGENGFVVDVATYAGVKAALTAIDADPERYRISPALKPTLRRVEAQVDELVELYRSIYIT